MLKTDRIFEIPLSQLLRLFLLGIIIISSIVVNILIGKNAISIARNQNFNGGICYAKLNVPENCNKALGFDIYSLHITLFLLAFSIGFRYANLTFRNNLFVVFIFSLATISIIEFTIRVFSLPVLYTHPMELRQSLHYNAFTLFGLYQLLFVLILSLASGVFGFVTAKFYKRIVIFLKS